MLEWTLKKIELELKFPWKIARGTAYSKTNFIVTVECDGSVGQGEVAFNTRYGESEEGIESSFKDFLEQGAEDLNSIEALIQLAQSLQLPASLSFGLESAMAHMQCAMTGKNIHQMLCVPQVHGVPTSFSLPIMPPSEVEVFINKHQLLRFSALKVKLGAEDVNDVVAEVLRCYSGPIRLDANEAFSTAEEFFKHCKSFKNAPIKFIEQPFKAADFDLYRAVNPKSPFDIFADESITDGEIYPQYKELFHGINVKLMKAGGYMRALKQLRTARELGLKTMVGCMIETSLGISSAMNIVTNVDYCDLDGCLLIKNDPFHAVSEEKGILNYTYVV